ncbi:unnamed protein product [Paramecium octaurelia]|uniref:Transmembrane protein n=1 Tax=Paramecium octaurelia TaxID=43137 RepID=A0A8S1WN15_PAROT|nr:unnamed protein product [Paramecium octaurelia]
MQPIHNKQSEHKTKSFVNFVKVYHFSQETREQKICSGIPKFNQNKQLIIISRKQAKECFLSQKTFRKVVQLKPQNQDDHLKQIIQWTKCCQKRIIVQLISQFYFLIKMILMLLILFLVLQNPF